MRVIDPVREPKQIVAQGYDRMGERYAEEATETPGEDREWYTSLVIKTLPAGAEVLDLGCGAGVPTTQRLAQHFTVTGVDISTEQVARARRNVPNATFIEKDMTHLVLPPARFDAVVAFFSIIHVPRDEQFGLLRAIATWLRPGGVFVGSVSASPKGEEVDYDKDWMGVPMFWSSFGAETNKRLIEDAGLRVTATDDTPYDPDDMFLWIVAKKPG